MTRGINLSDATTKLHAALTVDWPFVEGLLTGSQVHNVSVANTLFEDVGMCFVVEDKGYDFDDHSCFFVSNNTLPVILGQKKQKNTHY